MNEGGKGDKPRPFSVDKETFESNWDKIFGKKKEKTTDDYQDVLSTEDCVLNAFDETDDKITRYNEETQEVLRSKTISR